ncbi:MAG: winged helix-turn-helix transcriptional regulator [Nanoarchaeota archaeon]|nr:winged helix-turn-helix transcriptional regulator [Nanoarchaeota archaeon]MBU1704612.1 winged helix-turn-helix transcriptional regulator [Nanoarchaeota archaeon]
MKEVIYLIIAIVVMPLAFADANVLLTLKDVTDFDNINGVVVKTTINDKVSNLYIPKDDILKLELDDGTYIISLLIDDLDTPGMDYYGMQEVIVKDTIIQRFLVFPVGSLNGMVKDQLDNVIPNAKIKFECSKDIDIDYPEYTDNFGTFNVEAPEGICTVYARSGTKVAAGQITIEKGQMSEVDLKIQKSYFPTVELVAVLVIVCMIVLAIISIKKRKVKTKDKIKQEIQKGKIKLGKRAKDIIETLRDREKDIVNLLIENGGMTQAKLHHETGLAKSSLFRAIQSLENKQVITTRKSGKVKHVQLSDWFLETANQGS